MTDNHQKIRFFKRHIPAFECLPGCHDCCGPVTASSVEMAELPVKSAAAHRRALADLSCPHLGAKGCTVYADRPLICRLFGTTSELPCPHGMRPEVMIAPDIERQVMKFFKETRQVLV